MNKKTVLITGAAGYIGSKLTDKLSTLGYNVIAVDNLLFGQGPLVASVMMKKNVEFINTDCMDIPLKVIQKADIIFPLAALVGAPLCDKLKASAWRVNRDAIYWLLKQKSQDQRLIFPCTNSGYGSTGNEICTEETPMNSISIYGESKESAERAVMECRNTASFRLATVHGISYRPRIDLLVNFMTYELLKKNSLDLFQGNYRRNFVCIDDVINIWASAILDISWEKISGKVFNLGCDEDNMTKSTLVSIISSFFPSAKIGYSDKSDPDKRDYNVSSAKLAKYGLKATKTVRESVPELIKYFNFVDVRMINIMKNT